MHAPHIEGADRAKMEAAAAKLMDFSQPMDVPLLDHVVTTAFDASHPQVNARTVAFFSQHMGGAGLSVSDQVLLN